MKPLLLLSLILLSLTIFVDISSAQCYEHNPLNIADKIQVDCGWINEEDSSSAFQRMKRQNTQIIDQSNSTNMFQITFTCGINNPQLCGKVKNAFLTAGSIITGTLKLNTPITVNATFVDFCKSMGDCGSPQGFVTLGGAAPARTIPMQSSDGKQRYYPQALVKQFQQTVHRGYGPYDITAMFNSVPNFWFQSDGPISNTQSDFLFVILHELVHGLGFTSSWDDYINQVPEALTPEIGATAVGNKQQIEFFEYAFDQHMVLISTGKNTTTFTDTLNVFATGPGSKFNDPNQFAAAFESSPQYASAKQMFKYATTASSLGFLPNNETNPQKAVILETSLIPYAQGSSVSHVDYKTYTNTSDFLMRYLQDRGVSLADAILAGGNYSGGAIGPKLKLVLETLGYATQDNPNPYIPLPSSDTNSPPNSVGNDGSAATSLLTDLNFLSRVILVLAVILLSNLMECVIHF